MPNEPYRPGPSDPEGSAEIARLAAEGQHRIFDARASQALVGRKEGEKNLRVALGCHYGSPVRWISHGLLALSAVLMLAETILGTETFVLGLLVLPGGVLLRILTTPRATRARVAAERAWVTSLPFALEGYFEVLEAQPGSQCRLAMVLTWADERQAPNGDTVRDVFGVIDADVSVASSRDGRLKIRSGPISGATRTRVNGFWVYRNTRLVAYAHNLVDKVLLPLHRTHALARVALTR